MTLEMLSQNLGDFAKDIRLNTERVLSLEGAPGLSETQIFTIALACAYHSERPDIVDAILHCYPLEDPSREAAKTAVALMAMNNVYYRFTHLVEHPTLARLPAQLRMTALAKPTVDKVTFELLCLAISAIEGCGKCVAAHAHELEKAQVPLEGIQSAARIAAVMNALHKASRISQMA